MKEILVLLLKTLGLIIIWPVSGSAMFWIPCTVSYCTDVGLTTYFIIVFASIIVSIATCIWVQLKLDSLWSD